MTSSLIFKLDTHVGALLEELDKIDPVWYNASMTSPYRSFGGSIYNTGGRTNMTEQESLWLTRVHQVVRNILPYCYVKGTPSPSLYDDPDMYEDILEWIEQVVPELDGVWERDSRVPSGPKPTSADGIVTCKCGLQYCSGCNEFCPGRRDAGHPSYH